MLTPWLLSGGLEPIGTSEVGAIRPHSSLDSRAEEMCAWNANCNPNLELVCSPSCELDSPFSCVDRDGIRPLRQRENPWERFGSFHTLPDCLVGVSEQFNSSQVGVLLVKS